MTGPEQERMAARRAGRPLREVAVELFGRGEVDANWHADSWMRSALRRLRRPGTECRARPDGAGPGDGMSAGGGAGPAARAGFGGPHGAGA